MAAARVRICIHACMHTMRVEVVFAVSASLVGDWVRRGLGGLGEVGRGGNGSLRQEGKVPTCQASDARCACDG